MENAKQLESVSFATIEKIDRHAFLSGFLNPRAMLVTESLFETWMGRLTGKECNQHSYFKLSSGGFFLCPAGHSPMRVIFPKRWIDADLSPEATGILATLLALSSVANHCEDYRAITLYHTLHCHAKTHPQGSLICRAL